MESRVAPLLPVPLQEDEIKSVTHVEPEGELWLLDQKTF